MTLLIAILLIEIGNHAGATDVGFFGYIGVLALWIAHLAYYANK